MPGGWPWDFSHQQYVFFSYSSFIPTVERKLKPSARNWGELGDFNDWLGSIKDKYQQPDIRRKMGPYCKLWKDL